jgi:hypothetical protein
MLWKHCGILENGDPRPPQTFSDTDQTVTVCAALSKQVISVSMKCYGMLWRATEITLTAVQTFLDRDQTVATVVL